MGILDFLTGSIIEAINSGGYIGIFILMALEGSFLPVPSEIILPFSGFLVAQGQFSIWIVALVGALGNIVGTLVTYAIARYIGIPFLYRYGKYVLVTHNDIDFARKLFARYGVPIIFISRLIPGIRGFLPIPAGIAKMNVVSFVIYVFVGSFLWSLFLTYIGVVIGENWHVFSKYAHEAGTVALVVMCIAIGWWVRRQYKHLKKERNKKTI